MPRPNPKAIAEARDKVEEMEVQIAALSRAFKDQQANRNLEWQQVAAALPTGSALLSPQAFQPVNFKTDKYDEPRWLALLIPAGAKDESAIILKDLGSAGLVAEQFARLRAAESRENAADRLVDAILLKDKKEMQNILEELSVTAAVAEKFVRRFDAKSKEQAQKLHILLFGKKAETEVIPEDPTLERIGSRARRYKTALRIILFISRSALQMDLVLTVLYYRKIMLHWSEAWPC